MFLWIRGDDGPNWGLGWTEGGGVTLDVVVVVVENWDLFDVCYLFVYYAVID